MPPKVEEETTFLKFKRLKSTYVVPVALASKKNLTIEYLLSELVQAVNASGGLPLMDDDPAPLEVSIADLELAFPKSRETPYENEWLNISSDQDVAAVKYNDYDILAFKYADDADFQITQPEYVEE